MLSRLMLVCACVLCLQVEALSQPTTDQQIAALRADIQQIKEALGLTPDADAAQAATAPKPMTLAQRVAILEAEHEMMLDTQKDHGTAIGQIAKKDGDKYHWRFDATSQPAVNEFKEAIAATAPRYGKLWVRNLTGSDRWIVINGRQERILAGARDDFDVPVGTVETRVPGEPAKSWYIGLPRYEYSIDIKSRPYMPIVTRVYEYPSSIEWVGA